MQQCWELNPDERPTITSVCATLDQLLTTDVNYLDLLTMDQDEVTCSNLHVNVGGASCGSQAQQLTPPNRAAANHYVDQSPENNGAAAAAAAAAGASLGAGLGMGLRGGGSYHSQTSPISVRVHSPGGHGYSNPMHENTRLLAGGQWNGMEGGDRM